MPGLSSNDTLIPASCAHAGFLVGGVQGGNGHVPMPLPYQGVSDAFFPYWQVRTSCLALYLPTTPISSDRA